MNKQETMEKIMDEVKNIAVVGISKKPHRAGHYVPAYLQEQGYHIIPVNPYIQGEVLAHQSYETLSDVAESIDLVLLFQRSENVPPFVDEAIAVGAKAIWMQSGIANADATAKARAAGLDVVEDACMMVEYRRWRR